MWIHVGTCFADDSSPVNAILRLDLDESTGSLTTHPSGPMLKMSSNDGSSPGWLSRYVNVKNSEDNTDTLRVYVALEDDPGRALAYQVAPNDGSLTPIKASPSTGGGTAGRHPCYASIDGSNAWLFTSAYTEGTVAVIPINPDGSLGVATDSKHHHSSRVIPKILEDRQEAPHAHCIVPHPSNKWVVSCDLGLSMVFVYGFDSERGSLIGSHDDPRHLVLPESAGPRHCVWDKKGEMLFINNELTCTVTAASFDVDTGSLEEIQTIPVLPESVTPNRSHHMGGSDIAMHPNGRFLYAGCRSSSPGTIAILEGVEGVLKVLGHESTRGEVPRNFKLIRNGSGECKWFVVGNQETKTVCSYAVNSETGLLSFVSEVSTAPYKACNIACPSAVYA